MSTHETTIAMHTHVGPVHLFKLGHRLAALFHYTAVTVASLLVFTIVDHAWSVTIDPYSNGSHLALPPLGAGSGPTGNNFRAVLYNHGGFGVQEGGDPQLVVEMLAAEGFIAYAKNRSGTSIPQTLSEVQDGLAELMNLTSMQLGERSIVNGDIEPGVSLIGYSRGALMSLGAAELQVDGNGVSRQIDKVVLMAMAPGAGPGWIEGGATNPNDITTADQYLNTINLAKIDEGTTEFFMMVAANDRPPDNPNNNLVDLMITANDRMVNRNGTPLTSVLKIYDDWMSPTTGHNLFQKVESGGQELVNQQGYYWYDVVRFLNNQPIDSEYTTLVPEPHMAILWTLGATVLVLRPRCNRLL